MKDLIKQLLREIEETPGPSDEIINKINKYFLGKTFHGVTLLKIRISKSVEPGKMYVHIFVTDMKDNTLGSRGDWRKTIGDLIRSTFLKYFKLEIGLAISDNPLYFPDEDP